MPIRSKPLYKFILFYNRWDKNLFPQSNKTMKKKNKKKKNLSPLIKLTLSLRNRPNSI
jgi:hypothetical protein